jgi:hypothetical protein
MPRIFDNIDQSLLPALCATLHLADRADFCVRYFNLRGWKQIDEYIERWAGGPGQCCRLLVGMQRLAQDQLRDALSLVHTVDGIDNQTAIHLRKKLAEEFLIVVYEAPGQARARKRIQKHASSQLSRGEQRYA